MRLYIYPKDIAVILGKSYPTALREYQRIKFLLKKSKEDKITIKEYCKINDLEFLEVEKSLK